MLANTIKISSLLNDVIVLSQRACSLIRRTHYTGNCQVFCKAAVVPGTTEAHKTSKGQDVDYRSVVTSADLECQSLISQNLRALYPSAQLVGEEDEALESMEPNLNHFRPELIRRVATNNDFLASDKLQELREQRHPGFLRYNQDLLNLSDKNELYENTDEFLNDEVNEEDVCFWIDPLDGTGGFVNGHTEHVTCNIGISVKGKPLFGVIGKPFLEGGNIKMSATYVGGVSIGMHRILAQDISLNGSDCPASEQFKLVSKAQYLKPFDKGHGISTLPIICGAMNRNQGVMNNIIDSFKPRSVERVAGAGNKFLHLAQGKSDLYLNFVPGLKLWDTCAGDALVKSRFGVFTNAFSEHLSYEKEGLHTPQDGLVACQNPL